MHIRKNRKPFGNSVGLEQGSDLWQTPAGSSSLACRARDWMARCPARDGWRRGIQGFLAPRSSLHKMFLQLNSAPHM